MKVIKRTGEKQDFSEYKIKQSIMNAAKDAGLSEDKMKELTNRVSVKIMEMLKDKEEVTAQFIRDKILSELDETEKSAADAWRRYEASKKVRD